ncbi:unnamed protein product [Adineta steineri]|uniref:Isopenicillin N synthase-like Fe(2+) 2OG dioxygenase domain-containing protein n=1 Tax=Adineta steineri TaxID=433720 RepID=A0A814GT97_9BILA|nr:unnamed protein product [Adineta steineri]CAF3679570.1 unnamed protein product [Adineta steineri]CAF4103987.1 unnamed protein product [Adineta steineri]
MDKKSRVIIDLNKILNDNDFTEIKQMENEFKLNGWCFVYLLKELVPDPKLLKEMTLFFRLDTGKDRCSSISGIYGYSKVSHKEGIKLLTGRYYSKFAHKRLIPHAMVHPLNYLCQVLDATTKRLIEILDQNLVFQEKPSLTNLIERADLPLTDGHFGMLDIVSYFNTNRGIQPPPSNGQTIEEVNCVPHYDPGLLSLSILSTHEGLQLKDMTNNEWIDGPLESNIGVIWLGEAASRITGNRLKPGIHRVIYPQEIKPRLTIWYELCTIEQLKAISGEKEDEPMDPGEVIFENLPDSLPLTILPGEKKLAFLKRVEISYGLASSKAGPPIYKFNKHTITYPMTNKKF